MGANKKYYYLKLKDNFFETDEIIILESQCKYEHRRWGNKADSSWSKN